MAKFSLNSRLNLTHPRLCLPPTANPLLVSSPAFSGGRNACQASPLHTSTTAYTTATVLPSRLLPAGLSVILPTKLAVVPPSLALPESSWIPCQSSIPTFPSVYPTTWFSPEQTRWDCLPSKQGELPCVAATEQAKAIGRKRPCRSNTSPPLQETSLARQITHRLRRFAPKTCGGESLQTPGENHNPVATYPALYSLSVALLVHDLWPHDLQA